MKNSNSKPPEKPKSGIIKNAKFRLTALFVLIALASTVVFSSTASAGSLSEFLFGSGSAQAAGSTGASFFKPAAFFAAKPAAAPVVEENEGQNNDIATVTTDRTDYNPGETVIVTGSGFTVYEPITLKIDREGVEAATYQVNADEYGNFINRQFVIGADDLGASFAVKATGVTSGKSAQSVFTDGTMSYSPGSQNIIGGSAVVSGTSASFSQTVTSPGATSPPPCGAVFSATVASTPNSINLGGNPTTPFPAGFLVSTNPTSVQFNSGVGGSARTWTVSIQVPAGTAPGFYSAQIKATPSLACHSAGIGTQVVIEVKAPTPTDTTAPTTTVTSGTYISNSWTNQDVTVDLSSADNVGGVGMQSLSYTVTGPNNVSATTNVTGSPFTASIPVTAEGITTIQYFGKDTLNNTEATQTFYVNIDKTAPVLSLPGNISVQADDANGKVVNFNATATDRAPASQNASCTPASGSTFAIGTTPVNCSATDDVGNTSTGSFNVEVTPAAQSITFDALDGKTYGDGDFTLGATASSGLDVSFAASGDCTITGNTVHITGAGSCTITASQAGNASYAAAESVQQSFNIAKAAADCSSIAGYSGTYDGQPHGATGGCTGVDAGGAATGSTLDLGASYTNAPGGTANWTFTGGANYADQSGSVNIAIGKADATCSISGVTVTYDGASHGATGSCTGVGGEATGGTLNLGASFTDYPGGTANWSLTGSTNYNDKSGSVAIVIDKADANVVVNGYSGTYDGQSHGATGTATGVGGADLSAGLNLGNSFTNAPGGTANWTFSGGTNYADESGSVAINIGKADATVSVSGYTGTYDGAAHGATGSATGVGGTDLSAQLNLGSSFTDAPGGTANWSFTGGTNYNDKSGSVAIVIDKADANCTVNGYSNVYDGAAHGASGSCTGVGGVALSGLSLGSSYTNVPGGTASWTFSGGNNYLDESGSVEITIGKANATINVTPYNVTYNGAAHTATGTATGVLSEALSGLDLSGTTHTDAGSYTDTWTFTDVTGNYNNAANTVNDVIAKAPVTATAGGGSSTYDGTTKSPSNCAVTGTYTGNLTCVNNPATVGPNANTYPINAVVNGTGQSNFNVTYVAGSYVIGKANAVISVTGYNVVFDGASHTATGTATGAAGENLSGLLNLSSTTHTLVGTYTNDPWSFAGDANHNSANGTVSSSIGSWTLRGFHQPVGISNTYGTLLTPSNLVWNTVKGGQTVPLKFNVFAGMLELTSTGNMTFGVTEVTCNASATALEDAVDFTTTGGTSLRYSGTPGVDGQFVQNWQTPATANKCYRVALTTWDGSKLVSYFKTKK